VGKQGRAGFAGRQVLLREGTVYKDLTEMNTFIFKGPDDFVVRRPKSIFRKGVGTQPVLVGDHYQFILQLGSDAGERPEDAGVIFQLLQAVDLFVFGLDDQCTVAVNKKYFLHLLFLVDINLNSVALSLLIKL
jgi:hypothetical protein